MPVCPWRKLKQNMRVCISQQEATSLVTLTPTSSPCFIHEAKLNNYPLLIRKHTRTDCKSNKRCWFHVTRPLEKLQANVVTTFRENCRVKHLPRNPSLLTWSRSRVLPDKWDFFLATVACLGIRFWLSRDDDCKRRWINKDEPRWMGQHQNLWMVCESPGKNGKVSSVINKLKIIHGLCDAEI